MLATRFLLRRSNALKFSLYLLLISFFCASAIADNWNLLKEIEAAEAVEAMYFLDAAETAIKDGNTELAENYLTRAENIGGDRDRVRSLRNQMDSAKELEPIKHLLNLASNAIDQSDLDMAQRLLEEAQAVGVGHEHIARVQAQLNSKRLEIAGIEREAEAAARAAAKDNTRLTAPDRVARLLAARMNVNRPTITNSDFFNACVGMGELSDSCHEIVDDDMRVLCLARKSENVETACETILDEDLKYFCRARLNPDPTSQCNRIQDQNIRNTCLATSDRAQASMCYQVSTGPWQLFCAGLALDSRNCNTLNR